LRVTLKKSETRENDDTRKRWHAATAKVPLVEGVGEEAVSLVMVEVQHPLIEMWWEELRDKDRIRML
jgi:hypothetical protein